MTENTAAMDENIVDLDLIQQRLEAKVNFLEESNEELKFEQQNYTMEKMEQNMKISDLTDEVRE